MAKARATPASAGAKLLQKRRAGLAPRCGASHRSESPSWPALSPSARARHARRAPERSRRPPRDQKSVRGGIARRFEARAEPRTASMLDAAPQGAGGAPQAGARGGRRGGARRRGVRAPTSRRTNGRDAQAALGQARARLRTRPRARRRTDGQRREAPAHDGCALRACQLRAEQALRVRERVSCRRSTASLATTGAPRRVVCADAVRRHRTLGARAPARGPPRTAGSLSSKSSTARTTSRPIARTAARRATCWA